MIPVEVGDFTPLPHCHAGGSVVVVFGCGTNRRTYRRFSPGARCAKLRHRSHPEADLCLIGAKVAKFGWNGPHHCLKNKVSLKAEALPTLSPMVTA